MRDCRWAGASGWIIAALGVAALAQAPQFDVASVKPITYQVKYYQLTGGSDWIQSTFYQVQVKAADEAPTPQIRLMLGSLLADRFKLKVRQETRMQAGYASTLDNVATGLVYILEQPVVDQTGLKGHYDFRVHFDDGSDAAAVASAMAALHEVGLKLESHNVPVEMVVVESAERPTPQLNAVPARANLGVLALQRPLPNPVDDTLSLVEG